MRRELAQRDRRRSGWGLLELRPMRMSLEDIFLSLTDAKKQPAQRRPEEETAMSNILAIAQQGAARLLRLADRLHRDRLLRAAVRLLLRRASCATSSRQSMQAGMMGGAQAMNVNQQLIRPLLLNVTVIVLFLLPLITMRTYSEEKRSGTIELLLTSPLTDFADHHRQVPRRDGALRARCSRSR